MAEESIWDDEAVEGDKAREPLKEGAKFIPAIDDPSIPTYYVNDTYVSIKGHDITILLAQDIPGMNGAVAKTLARVTFSHAGFLSAMRFFNQYADFLDDMYDGNPPSLDQFETENVIEKMKEYGIYTGGKSGTERAE